MLSEHFPNPRNEPACAAAGLAVLSFDLAIGGAGHCARFSQRHDKSRGCCPLRPGARHRRRRRGGEDDRTGRRRVAAREAPPKLRGALKALARLKRHA